MGEQGHTEGDWVWSGDQLLANRPAQMCSVPVLVATDDRFSPSPADKALIAATPALLEALERAEGEVAEYEAMAKPPVKGRLSKSLRLIRAALLSAKPNGGE